MVGVATYLAPWVITSMPIELRAFLLLVFCLSLISLFALLSESWPRWYKWPSRLIVGILIVAFSLYQGHGEYLKEKALKADNMMDNFRMPKEAPWDPPKGPLVKFESSIPAPSNQLCVGLSEREELRCLCPRPIAYDLTAMPQPKDNNYAVEVTIRKVREPLYRVRLFSRTIISEANLIDVWPNTKNAITTLQTMDFDKYSIIIQSTAPQDRFKALLQTNAGLRIKCINQEN